MGAVEIAGALAASRRAVRLYPVQHPAHRAALRDLCAAVTESVDVRPVVLNLRDGRLYEGSDVVTEASPATRALAEAMDVRRVESLTFHMGFGETDGEGLSEVLGLRPSPELQVALELEARGVRAVTVSELEDNSSQLAEERDRRREADRALYRHALAGLKEITAGLKDGVPIEPAVAARAIAPLFERIAEDPEAVLALATMTGHGERQGFHAVSTMLRALVIGHRLEMDDRQLLALGTAALLHDVGASAADGDDPEHLRSSHPESGARMLGAVPDEDCAAMIVSYEHHMGVDGSGWPPRPEGYVTHPNTRIVAVAARYDNLVRPAEGRPIRPVDAVVQILREGSGGPLDPVIARLFVQVIGVVPIGSAVRLSDHSIGLVRSPGSDPLRPHVRLVLDAEGIELRPASDVDLTEDGRTIVEVLAVELLGLCPADHL